MKKLFSVLALMFLITSNSFFCSCSDDDEQNGSNPLVGTVWSLNDYASGSKEYYVRYVEFVSENTVNIWDTFSGSKIWSGKYRIEGNKVYFQNLYHGYWKVYYMYATFTSKSLTMYFSFDENDSTAPYSDTYLKN